MTCCPTCKQELPASSTKLIIDLNSNAVAFGTQRAKMSPQQTEIMAVLKTAYPKFVSLQSLTAKVYGLADGPESNSIAVQICHMRRVLQGFPLEIIRKYGLGYRLELMADII